MNWTAGKKIWIALGLVAAIAGCGGSGGGTFTSADPRLYFLSASSDSGPFDFNIDADKKASNIAFGQLSPQATTTAGDHDVVLLQAGTQNQLDALTNTFTADTDTLAFGVGLQNPDPNDPFGNEKLLRLAVQQVNLKTPNGTKARLIVVQGFSRASGFETPQVDLRPPGNNVPTGSTIANIDFGTSQTIDVDTTQNTFVIRRSGTEQVYIGPVTFNLAAGSIYIVLVSGVEGATTGNLKPQMQLIKIK